MIKKLLLISITFLCLNGFSQSNKPCNGSGAPSLPVESSGCDGSTWNLSDLSGTAYGSNSGDFGTPSCGNPGNPDGWFQFTAPASGNVTITTQAGTLSDLALQIYRSICDGTYTSIGCVDGAGMHLVEVTGLTGGATYYIRMWAESGSNGSFNICVQDDGGAISGCTDPSAHNYNSSATVDDGSCETCSDGIQNGDETGVNCGGALCPSCACADTYGSLSNALCSAPSVTVDGSCVNGDNTGVSLCANGGCLNEGSQDFMRFTATATDATVNLTSTGIQDADLGIISLGTACPSPASPTIEVCNTSSGSGSVNASVSGLTIGEEYYIFIESQDVDEGTFQICVTSPVYGCTDATAHNYDATATIDDGSCETCSDGIQNGDEAGIDCGGAICGPCSGGSTVTMCDNTAMACASTYTGCNANFYDSGGDGGDYTDSENRTKLLCASGASDCMQFTFNTFELEGCCDFFRIYDGTSAAAPLIGAYNGTQLNGQTIQSSGQCLFVQFTSDGSVVRAGWDAYVTCITCPTCTDGIQNGSETGIDCGGTCAPCPGSVCSDPWVISSFPYTHNNTTTCGGGDDYSSTDACGSSYMNGDDIVYEFTSAGNECLDIVLTNTGTWVGLFLLDDCPDAGGATCLSNATSSSGNPSLSYTVTSAGTYYIVISTFPSPQCTDYDLSITSSPAGGVGSTCANPRIITDNFNQTGLTTGCYGNDYNSTNACSSTYMNGDDYVFEYNVTTDACVNIALSNLSAGSSSGVFLLDGCPSSGGTTCIASSTGTSTPSINTSLTSGTYYLVVSSDNTPTSTTFDISVQAIGTPPANDICTNAVPLTIGTYADGELLCTGATGEPAAPGCWSFSGALNTVWYTVVAPASGELVIATNMDDPTSGFGTGTQIQVFSSMGSCTSLTPLACNQDIGCGDVESSSLTLTGLNSGGTYYIRVDGEGDNVPAFTIVALDPTDPTSFPSGSECVTPQPVCTAEFNVGDPGFQGVGTTCDFPGTNNCTGGERGSAWYTIEIANNGTLEFDIIPNDWDGTCSSETDYDFIMWKVNGSGSTDCATILSSSGDGEVACNFSSVGITGLSISGNAPTEFASCFYDGAYEPALSVNAGDIYLLNVSNYSNSLSGFTLDITSSAGVIDTTTNPLCGATTLSVKMANFTGEKIDNSNILKWSTVVESEHDYFEIERSFDGKNFEVISQLNSKKGTSYAVSDYKYVDKNVAQTAYYRLNSISKNGIGNYSKTVVINGDAVIPEIYPNPAKDLLIIAYKASGIGNFKLMSLTGQTIIDKQLEAEEGFVRETISLEGLSKGTYLVQIKTSEITKIEKLVIE